MGLLATTDADLLTRWRRHGDPKSFTALVDRHAAMVRATSARVLRDATLADDVTQDCFMLLAQLERFEGASVGGWLHRVARNRSLDHVRTQTHRREREQAFAETTAEPPTPDTKAILNEIDAALDALPESLREPVVLHYLEGRTHREIARALGISRSVATRRIQQALEHLRDELGARGVTAGLAAVTAALAGARSPALAGALVATLRKIALDPPSGAKAAAVVSFWPVAGAVAILAFIGGVAVPLFSREGSETAGAYIQTSSTTPTPPSTAKTPRPERPVRVTAQVETAQTEAANSIRPSTEPPAIGDTETVTLTCVDEKGQPVSGAEVYIVQIILHPMAGVGLTMEDDAEMRVTGPFGSGVDGRLPPLNFDTGRQSSYQAYARIAGELVGAWGLFRHNYPRGAQWDEIVLTPSTTVQGHVEVPKGFDVRNVTVRLLTTYVRDGKRGTIGSGFANAGKSREPIVPPLADRHPDPQGNFRFTDLPRNGNVYFAATAAGLGEAQHYQFEQVPGQTFSIEMELESTIFGSVRYENTNAPAAGVHVFARPRPGRDSKLGVTSHFVSKTDSLGRYQFNGLAEAAYDVFVYAAGNPIEWVAPVTSNIAVGVRESRGPVDLYYERGGWVEGTVRETHSGDPIADAMVCALNPADVGDGQALSVMTTQADGAFRMLLPTGDSLLYFMAVPNGFAYPKEQGRKTVTIERNQREALHVEFELEASEPYVDPGRAVVTGRVIDAVGLPIEGVPIHDDYEYTQGDKRMEHHFLGATGDDGRFRFHVSARGSHQIEIGGGRYAPRGYSDVLFNVVEKERFTAKTDETYELGDTVVERYTEVIGGTITDESGLAVANIDLWLRSDAWEGVRGATTDETGAFAFRYVPRGRFQLIVEPDEFERTVLDAESGFDYKITLKRADDPGPSPRN